MRKAQLSMFILTGVLILGAFIFLIVIRNLNNPVSFESKAEKAFKELMQNTPIKSHVYDCIEGSLDHGLRLIGKQGGIIFRNQIGNSLENLGMPDPDYVYHPTSDSNITLVIKNIGTIAAHEPYSNVPEYPCRKNPSGPCANTNPVNPTNPCYFIFGTQTSRSTGCVTSTTNPKVTTEYLTYGRKRFFAKDSGDASRRPTFKEQIERFVGVRTQDCADFTAFAKKSGHDVTAGAVKTNIKITEHDIVADVNFPLMISVDGKPPITKVVDFRVVRNSRFGELTHKIDLMISKDSAILDFDLLDGLDSALDDNFEVSKEPELRYDIFVIKDHLAGGLDGEPYVFQFARQNRPPVLDYITGYAGYSTSALLGHPPYTGSDDDYQVNEGDAIRIDPSAIDPDEDEDVLVYDYLGWSAPDFMASSVCDQDGCPVEINAPATGGTIQVRVSDGELNDRQSVKIYVSSS